ncbi:hypothetical protein G419_14289 [Rhodococcus triatomae BKS 15-14]|nr:hypothetical protein G419_14289 [Rhodococcus triatomae BKS 15-14]
MAACSVCPLLAQCGAQLNDRLAAGEKVSGQIQAGRLFNADGGEVDPENTDAFATARGLKKRRKRSTSPTSVPAAGRPAELFPDVAA